MPRRRHQVDEGNSIGDGDKQARSPGRARRKPLTPSRAGMPGDPGVLVVTNARATYTTRAAAGARAPGIPHALSGGRKIPGNPRAFRAARTRSRVFSRAKALSKALLDGIACLLL